jgi:radical SAM superfamily enzyme YgiQ (UPF0313 family)
MNNTDEWRVMPMPQRRVLLIEPNYKNRYPPLGLLKLATYFRRRGDDVRFYKGELRDLAVDLLFEEFWESAYDKALGEHTGKFRKYIRTGKRDVIANLELLPVVQEQLENARLRYKAGDYPKFDLIGVSTLFTFYYNVTVKTINEAKQFLASNGRLLVGGVASTILPNRFYTNTGIHPHLGLLDTPGVIDENDSTVIDTLPLDYSCLEEIEYKYPQRNAYLVYATRGCVRNCDFCTVRTLEPMTFLTLTSVSKLRQLPTNLAHRKICCFMIITYSRLSALTKSSTT